MNGFFAVARSLGRCSSQECVGELDVEVVYNLSYIRKVSITHCLPHEHRSSKAVLSCGDRKYWPVSLKNGRAWGDKVVRYYEVEMDNGEQLTFASDCPETQRVVSLLDTLRVTPSALE